MDSGVTVGLLAGASPADSENGRLMIAAKLPVAGRLLLAIESISGLDVLDRFVSLGEYLCENFNNDALRFFFTSRE